MATWWAAITDIPAKIFAKKILPFCEVKDVLSLSCTNKFFALVVTDEAFWRQKVAVDYNFTESETTRTSNWKIIYQRFSTRNPQVFIWGCVIFSFCYVMQVLTYVFLITHLVITKQMGVWRPTWVAMDFKYSLVQGSFSS